MFYLLILHMFTNNYVVLNYSYLPNSEVYDFREKTRACISFVFIKLLPQH